MPRVIHELVQGSPEWHAHRLNHFNASEAAAMLGISKYQTRNDLVKEKATGVTREHSAEDLARFAGGHRFEAIARPWAEEIIGEDLYPITASLNVYGLPLSASFDGVTIAETITFEHKQLNKELAAALAVGEIPAMYKPQMEQQLLVLGAEKCLFMASDGLRETMQFAWYTSDTKVRQEVIAGWKQFREDRDAYQHVEVIPGAVAAPVKGLPVLDVHVDGALAVRSNLDAFGAEMRQYIAGINMKPEDDQAFADAEKAIKVMESAEGALKLAMDRAMAQTGTIEELRQAVAELSEVARTTRLKLEKAVKAEKENIRAHILQGGKDALAQHIAGLNKRLGQVIMPTIAADFAGAMKQKKTVSSLQNAVDTELARVKIEASGIADRIQINLEAIKGAGMPQLFPDVLQIALKAPDDLATLVKMRVADHQAAEQRRQDGERERIREEERKRLEAEQRATAALAQAAAMPVVPAPVEAAPAAIVRLADRARPAEPATPFQTRDEDGEFRPTDGAMVHLLATTYRVSRQKVIGWLVEMDLQQLSENLAPAYND